MLTGALSPAEHARAERFVRTEDRRRFAAAHGLVRRIIAGYLGLPPAALTFATDPHGKPELAPANNPSGLVFNLSHSHDQLLLGLTWRRKLGVDVEKIRPNIATPELARASFADAECQAWLSLPPGQQAPAFFSTWTRKEAYLKALGLGLQVPLRDFEVTVSPDESPRLTRRWSQDTEETGWTVWSLFPKPGFAATVVGAGPRLHLVTQCWQAPALGA